MTGVQTCALPIHYFLLTGHKERIVETERLTTEKKELDTCQQEIINNALQRIRQNIKNCPNVTITYFIPDSKKEGGKYITVIEHVKKIDDYENIILLSNGSKIIINDIYDIELSSI